MRSPKYLPCYHTFCGQCVQKLCISHVNKNGNTPVPCPLCRSPFAALNGYECSSLPTNVYVEELMRLAQIADETELAVARYRKSYAVVTEQLKKTTDERDKALCEKRGLDQALAKTTSILAELEERPTRLEKLESRVQELERDLCAAESREAVLSEKQRQIAEQLNDAEHRYRSAVTEAETYKEAKIDAEVSLERERELSESLHQQLQQLQCETTEQLADAELWVEAAKTEAEVCRKAKNDAQTAVEKEKQACLNLRQKQQQMRCSTSEQIRDAERRVCKAKMEAAACQLAKSDSEASLEKEKQLCENLRQQLHQLQQKMRKEDPNDVERPIVWEENMKGDACRKAGDDKIWLSRQKQALRRLRWELGHYQVRENPCEPLRDDVRPIALGEAEKPEMEARVCWKAGNDAEAFPAMKRRRRQILLQQTQEEIEQQEQMLTMQFDHAKLEITSLKQQLHISKLKLDQQKDYRKGLL